MQKLLLPFLLILAITAGCVSEPKVNTNTPEGLFTLGEFYQKQERFEEAINQFKAVSSKFPYSKLATEAELRVADCYYKKEEYIEAFNAYKTFKELHPKHPQIDYVTYFAAESIREQLPSTVDRDLSQATQAINYYEEIVTVYPNSKYAAESKEKRFKLIGMLADKELYIADFYYRREKYLGALTRYDIFLQMFPQNTKVPHALLGAARSAKQLNQPEKIPQYVERLIADHGGSSEAKQAKSEFPNVAR